MSNSRQFAVLWVCVLIRYGLVVARKARVISSIKSLSFGQRPPISLKYCRYDFKARSPRREPSSKPADRSFSQVLSEGPGPPYWTINGHMYPQAETLLVREGERVRIEYVNRSRKIHPMHLHGHFFKVVNPYVPEPDWILKDTIVVSHGQRVEIEFTADNPGKWFHHCHHLYHMAAGMANVVAYEG